MTDDEIEAASLKYNCARIVRLSSGNFALFYPWSNSAGMPLVGIGSLDNLAALIPSADEVISFCEETAHDRSDYDVVKAKSLLQSLGFKPKPPPEPLRRL